MSLRELQKRFDARRGNTSALASFEGAVSRAVTEYEAHPSPALHAAIGRSVQELIRASGGVRRGNIWKAP